MHDLAADFICLVADRNTFTDAVQLRAYADGPVLCAISPHAEDNAEEVARALASRWNGVVEAEEAVTRLIQQSEVTLEDLDSLLTILVAAKHGF